MILSKNTCPREIYSNFVSVADFHIREIRSAIESKNIKKLGELYEEENLLFRKVCLNTRPPAGLLVRNNTKSSFASHETTP